MERQHTHSGGIKSIAGSALAGLGILVLVGSVGWTFGHTGAFFRNTAGNALGILTCILLAACQAIQATVFDHCGLMGWLLHALLPFGPLLSVLGAAI